MKKDIVVLHGWGSSPERWDQLLEELSYILPNAAIHVPFIPGFDPSDPPKKPYRIADYSDWLYNYIHRKGLSKPVIIGHSNGGRIAINFAANHPKALSKLVLINAAGIKPKNSAKKYIFKSLSTAGKRVLSVFRSKKIENIGKNLLYKLTGERDYHKASPTMKKTMLNMLSYDARGDLHQITTPTLCIWGDDDPSTPLWMGQAIRDGIANAHLKIIPSGKHNIHRTHPIELAKLIVDFV